MQSMPPGRTKQDDSAIFALLFSLTKIVGKTFYVAVLKKAICRAGGDGSAHVKEYDCVCNRRSLFGLMGNDQYRHSCLDLQLTDQ